MVPSFDNKFLFRVTGTSYDFWLLKAALFNQFSDLVCCLKPIHNRHAQIHKNQSVLRLAWCKWIADQSYRFLSTGCLINVAKNTHVTCLSHEYLEAHYIIELIIDYEYSFVLFWAEFAHGLIIFGEALDFHCHLLLFRWNRESHRSRSTPLVVTICHHVRWRHIPNSDVTTTLIFL